MLVAGSPCEIGEICERLGEWGRDVGCRVTLRDRRGYRQVTLRDRRDRRDRRGGQGRSPCEIGEIAEVGEVARETTK